MQRPSMQRLMLLTFGRMIILYNQHVEHCMLRGCACSLERRAKRFQLHVHRTALRCWPPVCCLTCVPFVPLCGWLARGLSCIVENVECRGGGEPGCESADDLQASSADRRRDCSCQTACECHGQATSASFGSFKQ